MDSILRPVMRPVLQPVLRSVFCAASGGTPIWTPASLFENGEQGALYYFTDDFAGLYKDAAGTIPVTAVEQPVGLMLDKSKGLVLGPELVTNNSFDSGATGWVVSGANISISGGKATWSGAGANERITQPGLDAKKLYRVTYTVSDYSEGSVYPLGGSTAIGNGNGTWTTVVKGVTSIYIRSGGIGFTGAVTECSYRELPGNHASQPTAASRPVLKETGTVRRINFDGVDDKLTTTFPNLGSNVTIARSVPGVGASILTGQTVGAGAWDDSTNHCGLVIVNRALTGPETASLTTYLNELAGV